MSDKQITINKKVSLTGTGLHTGEKVTLSFVPAKENTGYVLKRTDIEGQPEVKAVAENVVDTSRGTKIAKGDAVFGTIEHVLSAVYGMGIDNILIEMDGPETPIMDGSSIEYLKLLKEAGLKEQEADREYFVVNKQISYTDNERGVEITLYPDDEFSVDVLIDYNSKILFNQFASLKSLDDYDKEISSCRTFVFLRELEMLLNNNLIKGGDLSNAIVIIDNEVNQDELDRLAELFNKPSVRVKQQGVLNNLELKYTNEPARHKLLDVIGDLSLCGKFIKGKIIAKRPGHKANTDFAKILRDAIKKQKPDIPKYDPTKKPLMDINKIKTLLPHRPPFLLVDKIIEMDDDSIIGLKNVTMNEGFFVGHFPEEPVMPAVLQIEALAQAGGVLALSQVPDPENYLTYFLKMDNVKLRNKVVPGDTLIFKLKLVEPIRRGLIHMNGKAYVGNNIAIEGDFLAQIVKTKNN